MRNWGIAPALSVVTHRLCLLGAKPQESAEVYNYLFINQCVIEFQKAFLIARQDALGRVFWGETRGDSPVLGKSLIYRVAIRPHEE
jgi:hypothetical protein